MSGPYLTQYEVYYKRLDPEATGEIGAMDAAKFLKNSGLADEFLGKVSRRSKGAKVVGQAPDIRFSSKKIPIGVTLHQSIFAINK